VLPDWGTQERLKIMRIILEEADTQLPSLLGHQAEQNTPNASEVGERDNHWLLMVYSTAWLSGHEAARKNNT